jgi:hypothetical protein
VIVDNDDDVVIYAWYGGGVSRLISDDAFFCYCLMWSISGSCFDLQKFGLFNVALINFVEESTESTS